MNLNNPYMKIKRIHESGALLSREQVDILINIIEDTTDSLSIAYRDLERIELKYPELFKNGELLL